MSTLTFGPHVIVGEGGDKKGRLQGSLDKQVDRLSFHFFPLPHRDQLTLERWSHLFPNLVRAFNLNLLLGQCG